MESAQKRMLAYTMKKTLVGIVLLLLSTCAVQKTYTLREFLCLHSFEAIVIEVVDLPAPPTFPTALSGPDKQVWLRNVQGDIIVVDRVPTSLGGNFCGTIDTWLELKAGNKYTFPDLLRPKPHCIEVYTK